MHFSLPTIAALLDTATALAAPNKRQQFEYKSLTLKFSSGPASYTLNLQADGNSYPTNNPSGVSLIELISSPPDFNIFYYCNYYTDGYKQVSLAGNGDGRQVAVGPPQPVTGVACRPTSAQPGGCLPNYATCSWSSQQSGTFLSCCQSGYCAASKCRPTS